MNELLDPVTPGELLSEEFLKPMGLSQYRLAKEIGVPAQRIGQIVLGRRAVTADTDLRLCRFFGRARGMRRHLFRERETSAVLRASQLPIFSPPRRTSRISEFTDGYWLAPRSLRPKSGARRTRPERQASIRPFKPKLLRV